MVVWFRWRLKRNVSKNCRWVPKIQQVQSNVHKNKKFSAGFYWVNRWLWPRSQINYVSTENFEQNQKQKKRILLHSQSFKSKKYIASILIASVTNKDVGKTSTKDQQFNWLKILERWHICRQNQENKE